MIPRKLKVYVGFPAYAGNGGYSCVLPEIMFWWARTYHELKTDPRVDSFACKSYCDTPITMVRNRIVADAKKFGADVLVMVDSDNAPDCEPDGKPFWESSFDYLYKHYEKGPVVIYAPYAGPPPHEVPYVFEWVDWENGEADRIKLNLMNRERAISFSGIVDMAGGPTGLIMYDMRAFDLIDHPYFDYEYKDETRSEKASTEDVYNTRNISLAGMEKLGYNPLLCNFDAWAGHAKNKMVTKPKPVTMKSVHKTFRDAVLRTEGLEADEKMMIVGDACNQATPLNGHPRLRQVNHCG